jgi:TnsA-like endonuclease N terminal
VSVRLHGGQTVPDRPLRQVTAAEIVAAAPWRTASSARGQAHYPGFYWSATAGGHVIYESRLELARLLLADFDPDVVMIAAQPFLLRAAVGGRVRRHVPDFLLVHANRTVQVVNVKPAARLSDPVVAEALAGPGELFEARGWGHEIWTGADPVLAFGGSRSGPTGRSRAYRRRRHCRPRGHPATVTGLLQSW